MTDAGIAVTREGVRRRLLHGLSANAFGSVVTVGVQLVTVPVLIHAWGTRIYGEWLMLIALPTFLAMADWGFENVAGNEMTSALARNDREYAVEVYQTLRLWVTLFSAAIVAAVAAVARFIPATARLIPGGLEPRMVTIVTVVLVSHVAVMLQGGLIRAGFRCTGGYAIGVMHQNLARVTDGFAVVGTAVAGGGPLHAALAMLLSRIVMTVIAERQMKGRNSWLMPGMKAASLQMARKLRPGIVAMMAFPLGFALSLQGMVAVVGLTLGPVVVVVFVTLRTLSRFIFQLGGVISNAIWPEVSFAFGSHDMVLARTLHRRTCQTVAWLAVFLAVAIAIGGRRIVAFWTHDAVPFNPAVLYVLLLVALIDSIWTASSVIALGAGQYHRISAVYAASTALSVLAAVMNLNRFGIAAAPLALLAASMVMLPYVVLRSLTLTDDNVSAFTHAVVRGPSPVWLFRRMISGDRE